VNATPRVRVSYAAGSCAGGRVDLLRSEKCDHSSMVDRKTSVAWLPWRRVPRLWRVVGLGSIGLLGVAVAALETWEHPPGWLHSGRVLVVALLHWIRVHWLTSGAVGIMVTLLVYVVQRRTELQRIRADQQQQAIAARAVEAQRQEAAEAALGALLTKHCWVDEATGWLPRVRQVTNPVTVGVHPAVDLPARASEELASKRPRNVPVYVPRDLDSALDRALARNGFVLLVGDSTAGKSRAAFEAMHRCLADWWLLVPSRRESLKALLEAGIQFRDTLVWLNDLDRYLGPDGLDEGLLRRLLGDGSRRIVVLATMRATEYAMRSPIYDLGQPDNERARRRAEQTLLDQVTDRLEVFRRFSDAEQQRARERIQDDPRIAAALDHADRYGLAEYLAAGPKLLQEWRDAWAVRNQPAGAALVAAAVDCRRAGLTEPIPTSLLLKLAPSYLAATDAGLLSPNAFESGLEWASTPRYGASALLMRHGDGGYLAFDYLFDSLERDPNAAAIPDTVWQGVVEAVTADTARSVGLRADYARPRQPQIAEQAYRKAVDAGDAGAIGPLATLIEERGDLDEAATWYRRAADAGNHDAMRRLGWLAEERGDLDEAAIWNRRTADAGDLQAMRWLGWLAEKRGNIGVAQSWYRKAADFGDLDAMRWLAWLAELEDDPVGAADWYLKAADSGDLWATERLGRLAEYGHTSAIHALRTAADDGALWAMQELRKRARAGSPPALDALRIAADEGALWAIEMLGWLANRRGDHRGAEAWFRRASDAGDPTAVRELGRLAEERGDLERAVAWYSRIAGDPEATEALSRLAEAGSSAALGALHRAADTGDLDATDALRRLAVRRGDSVPEGSSDDSN
jgi:uncharacterized protein